ncbi:hypothetical protein LOK49_LG14G01227 [Camellia lanceoleosa]|uniref:Uncharacterized protein n=1 Tax=Camellia lanceoleosa TaxID=1840588 RepID=A0ACC0FDD8_9ERIC|nr:hypothetical protein LOK49_LG14G01227 [Camellia lanceoleosa]
MAITSLDLVKCNMQIDPSKYKSISSGFGVLMQEQGVRSFFKGWVPILLGYSAQGACKFGFYEATVGTIVVVVFVVAGGAIVLYCKMRRGDRLIRKSNREDDGEDSSEESVNDEEDDDDDDYDGVATALSIYGLIGALGF